MTCYAMSWCILLDFVKGILCHSRAGCAWTRFTLDRMHKDKFAEVAHTVFVLALCDARNVF